MAWPRKVNPARTTPERRALNAAVLQRDQHICYLCGQGGADSVDAVVPTFEGGQHTMANCRAVHARPCHARKSAREGGRARARAQRTTRPKDPHPGLLPAPEPTPRPPRLLRAGPNAPTTNIDDINVQPATQPGRAPR